MLPGEAPARLQEDRNAGGVVICPRRAPYGVIVGREDEDLVARANLPKEVLPLLAGDQIRPPLEGDPLPSQNLLDSEQSLLVGASLKEPYRIEKGGGFLSWVARRGSLGASEGTREQEAPEEPPDDPGSAELWQSQNCLLSGENLDLIITVYSIAFYYKGAGGFEN